MPKIEEPPVRRLPWKAREEERASDPREVERRRRANALGAKGELAALAYLEARGAKLLARNFRCPLGEIDLLLEYEGELVAVEVKTRTLGGLEMPEDALTGWKIRRVLGALGWYAMPREIPEVCWRIDAVVIDVDHEARVQRIEHLKGLFADDE
jgi:putative endonuclease